MGVFALNPELRQAKVLAGEVDVASPGLGRLSDHLSGVETERKGTGPSGVDRAVVLGEYFVLMPNLTHKAPERRALFQDIKFRKALSLAIDRDEINEILYLGLATPQQSVPVRRSGFYWEDQAIT